MWCLGATLYTMFMGHSPFRRGREDRQVSVDTLKKRILFEDIFTESSRWQKATAELQSLIRMCMEKDVTKRVTLEQILQHNWFNVVVEQQEEAAAAPSVQIMDKLELSVIKEDAEEEDEYKYPDTLPHFEQESAVVLPKYEIVDKQEFLDNICENDNYESNIIEAPAEFINDSKLILQEPSTSAEPHSNVRKISDMSTGKGDAEDDTTSGLGHSKSSDEMLDIPGEIIQVNAQDAEHASTLEDNASAHEDNNNFHGFDEKLPVFENFTPILKVIRLLQVSRRFCEKQPPNTDADIKHDLIAIKQNDTTIPHINEVCHTTNTNARSMRRSVRGCDLPPPPVIAKKSSQKMKSTNLNPKSITISKEQNVNSITKKDTAAPTVGTTLADGFAGFKDYDRRRYGRKAKASWRMFCYILHNTQVSLKHFNIERRVYRVKSTDEQENIPKSIKQVNQPLPQLSVVQQQDVAPAPSPAAAKSLPSIRQQPLRMTRTQRAVYVFE